MKSKQKYALVGFLFVLPSFLYYIFIFLYPLISSFINSFSKVNILLGTSTFVGIKNFKDLFARTQFWNSLVITFKFALISVPLLMMVDLFVANKLSQYNGFKNKILTTISFLPFIVSMAAAGMVWDWILDPNFGIVNSLLGFFSLEQPMWLRSPETALKSTLLITLWIRAPFGIMILLGGIQNVSQELYEAADIDGVTPWQRFYKITLPLINPQIVMLLTLETIFAFRAFDQIYTATSGGPAGSTTTLMIYLIKDLFNTNYGIASALTVLLLLFLFFISFLQQSLLRKKVNY